MSIAHILLSLIDDILKRKQATPARKFRNEVVSRFLHRLSRRDGHLQGPY